MQLYAYSFLIQLKSGFTFTLKGLLSTFQWSRACHHSCAFRSVKRLQHRKDSECVSLVSYLRFVSGWISNQDDQWLLGRTNIHSSVDGNQS